MNPQIKFQQLHPDFVLPTKAHETDAMYDVVATSCQIELGYVTYGLGFATEIPERWAGYFHPRSSISKYDLVLCNSCGIIDAGYRGEWQARFKYVPDFSSGLVTRYHPKTEDEETWFDPENLPSEAFRAKIYEVGDRIGQICFAPLPYYDLTLAPSLSSTQRGAGGFGSTDK